MRFLLYLVLQTLCTRPNEIYSEASSLYLPPTQESH